MLINVHSIKGEKEKEIKRMKKKMNWNPLTSQTNDKLADKKNTHTHAHIKTSETITINTQDNNNKNKIENSIEKEQRWAFEQLKYSLIRTTTTTLSTCIFRLCFDSML